MLEAPCRSSDVPPATGDGVCGGRRPGNFIPGDLSAYDRTQFRPRESFAGGNATLENSADGVDFTTLWAKSGNQGGQWHQATVFVASGGHRILRNTCVPNCC